MAKQRPNIDEVVQRVLSESVLTVSQARTEIASITGQRPEKSSVIRWILRGADGVYLDGCKLSRDWLTSREAINRFVIARTEKAMG
jgi:hypothetical protein